MWAEGTEGVVWCEVRTVVVVRNLVHVRPCGAPFVRLDILSPKPKTTGVRPHPFLFIPNWLALPKPHVRPKLNERREGVRGSSRPGHRPQGASRIAPVLVYSKGGRRGGLVWTQKSGVVDVIGWTGLHLWGTDGVELCRPRCG